MTLPILSVALISLPLRLHLIRAGGDASAVHVMSTSLPHVVLASLQVMLRPIITIHNKVISSYYSLFLHVS